MPHIPHSRDSGASAVEYASVLVLVAAIFAGLALAVGNLGIAPHVSSAVCTLLGSNDCAESGGGADAGPDEPAPDDPGGDPVPASNAALPETEPDRPVEFRVQPVGNTSPDEPEDSPEPEDEERGDGPEPMEPGSGLGEPGSVPEGDSPPFPEFTDPGVGSGEYASEVPGKYDLLRKNELLVIRNSYRNMANVGGLFAPHAQEYLDHFLDNTGETVELPVDEMLEEVPSFQETVDDDRELLGEEAVDRARESGATEPVTFPISTDWAAHDTNSGESTDWYYAVGSWYYAQSGEVTVHPPEEPGGEWTYEVDTRVRVEKEYDWDPDKEIGPGNVIRQRDLADLHKAGWAQEYSMEGTADPDPYEGSVP